MYRDMGMTYWLEKVEADVRELTVMDRRHFLLTSRRAWLSRASCCCGAAGRKGIPGAAGSRAAIF